MTEFGGLVSSSNAIVKNMVSIQTSKPLFWTTAIRKELNNSKYLFLYFDLILGSKMVPQVDAISVESAFWGLPGRLEDVGLISLSLYIYIFLFSLFWDLF